MKTIIQYVAMSTFRKYLADARDNRTQVVSKNPASRLSVLPGIHNVPAAVDAVPPTCCDFSHINTSNPLDAGGERCRHAAGARTSDQQIDVTIEPYGRV